MLILIHGENSYLSFQKLQELKQNRLFTTLDSEEFDFSLFSEKAIAAPLFDGPGLLVVKGVFSVGGKGNQEKIKVFLEKNTVSGDLVLYEEKTVRNKAFVGLVEKRGQVYYFPKFNRRELKDWLKKQMTKDGYQFDKEIVEMLIAWLGEDLWVLSSELAKLKIASQEGKQITKKRIGELSVVKTAASIFDLVDSIGSKEPKQSLILLTQSLRFGQSPLYILSMITRQYRLLLQIRDFMQRGYSYEEIKEKMHLAPFVTGKLFSQVRRYSIIELEKIYEELLMIDSGIKKGEDPVLSLELLINRIGS